MTAYKPFINAKPVWASDLENEMNITLGFYAEICKQAGKKYILKITGSSFYRIFINGKLFEYGPVRCGHGFYRVDELDLSEIFTEGKNSVAIEVAGYNINSFYTIDQPSFLQAEICEDEKVLVCTSERSDFSVFLLTDRVRKMQKYSFQRAFGESYKLTYKHGQWRVGKTEFETPVTLELTEEKNLLQRGIPVHNFPKASPEKVTFRGKNKINPERIPTVKDRSLVNISDKLKGFKENELELHLSDEIQMFEAFDKVTVNTPYSGETIISENEFETMSFEGEKTGFIGLSIECLEEGTFYLFVDETLTDNDVNPVSMDCLNAIRFDVEKGKMNFLSFEPFGFMHLKAVCTKGKFILSDIHILEYICPVPFVNDYKGSDPVIAKIYKAAIETYKQNAADIFMDCPTRERAGWLCDSFFLARTEKLFTGKNLTEKIFLENFLYPDSFKCLPDGMLPMCYPGDHYDDVFIPNWAMWFVVELEDYLKRTGDRKLVDDLKNKVYALLKYFIPFENEYGLLEKLESWIFVEWSQANFLVQDVNYPTNMLYSYTLKAVGGLYGDSSLISKSEKIADTVRERSYDGTFFVDNDVRKDGVLVSTGERTETCQYYAFFFDIVTPESHPELWDKLTKEFGPERLEKKLYPEIYPSNAFIGNYLRLDVLTRYGLKEQCLKEVCGYFLYMAEKTGTLWENITDFASCNHGFASYAAYLIDKCLAD